LAELYVLDGALSIAGERFAVDCYAVFPAGMAWCDVASANGAVLLIFFDREPQAEPARYGEFDRSLAIARVDTHELPWTAHDIDPSVQFLRLSHKVLRHCARSGERTILLASGAQTHPQGWRAAQLRHDCVEEMYLLGGDIIGERGIMYEGAYFWRPPRIWHGPFGSRRGSLALIRFSGGRHANEWGPVQLPFTLEPAYAPELPPELASAASQPWSPPRF
ncbi:MAG: hypothetical protein NZM12_12210, partial [Steroidobacteraceae bacterium]|nr:hypothetical protein [Steroidobacteraceae bacterium]MDW8259404.1 hypothetical protein [Gammaproteobacteria bacterium]